MTVKREQKHTAIGKRLKFIRTSMTDCTQDEFASLTGFKQSGWNQYEKGFRRIPPEAAIRLVQQFGVTLDWIYLGRLDMLPPNIITALSCKPTDR